MSAKRAPMSPPDLPGFTYVDVLGSGGFADVYLYEQHLPRRRVAVKVLLTERISTGSVSEFTAEANVMAMLSTHPAIVTIYQAAVARDGRPYLVMEYCPRPNLQVRYRREPFSIAESLRVGIQVAAAVETAHRAGVLHRDIKPANILVTEYNRPALTDFGIASTTAAASESAGLSIPWSPPESFADVPHSDPRSDVYALGATVYTLLAGRSPFEIPDQRNTAADLIQRIETMPLPPLGRADAPASLMRTLERAMAKPSADRFETALAFARALQKVQIELSHSVTPIDILDDSAHEEAEPDEDDGLTRVRGVVSINPETSPAAGLTRPSAITVPVAPRFDPIAPGTPPATPAASVAFDTVRRDAPPAASVADTVRPGASFGAPGASIDETIVRSGAPVAPTAQFETPALPAPTGKKSRRALWWSVSAAAVVIVGVIVGVSLPSILGGGAEPKPTATEEDSEPQDPIGIGVAAPEDLVGTVVPDGVAFTWTNPAPAEGDTYLWSLAQVGVAPDFTSTPETGVTVPADPTGKTCIEVMVRRANGTASEPTTECTP
ncbi:serine/threonine protein kinase [Microbacterium sp. Root61]|uniref:serine/threonine-protein kinase n=1 Tax=Microbacterium sp. Root61 TaxID=1736570 RepID=UPI000701ACE8|nr:serine/threonine-protein kinase [Microbacterium sp. Root61]KRA25032.1 serine/threonine protein kinase [Microbacterium sp. Root61]